MIFFFFFSRFDYGYAVGVVTQFVVLHTILWVPYGLWEIWNGRKYGYYVVMAHILTAIFVNFEIFDFIPVWRVRLFIWKYFVIKF